MAGRAPRRAAVGAALVATLAFAGCGGEDDATSGGSGEGIQLSAPINLADCTDWNEGSVEERLGTIASIRDYTGGDVAGAGAAGRVLPDDRAYDLFENYCENEFARGFKLYKLYGRAAAFSGRTGEQ
ncbi:MAG: hypothetical protein ACRDKH_06690 [Solirubrobacterales bacterium]